MQPEEPGDWRRQNVALLSVVERDFPYEMTPTALEFGSTPRNEPMRRFLEDPNFRRHPDGIVAIDLAEFRSTYADDLALFALMPPSGSRVGTTG
ncbi:MAG TPA: hypothetical protein VF962_10690 [Gemmatimonadaceae bacterium]